MQYVSTVRWVEMIMWCYKICERTKVLVHTILGGSLKYKEDVKWRVTLWVMHIKPLVFILFIFSIRDFSFFLVGEKLRE